MPEERRLKSLERRKEELGRRNEILRGRAGGLWREADRPIRTLEDGLNRLRHVHPLVAGAAGIGLFFAVRKLAGNRKLVGPLLSLGLTALELAISRKAVVPAERNLPRPRRNRRRSGGSGVGIPE